SRTRPAWPSGPRWASSTSSAWSRCPTRRRWPASRSSSRLTSRMRLGLFLTVATPSEVSVASMMYVGMRAFYPIMGGSCSSASPDVDATGDARTESIPLAGHGFAPGSLVTITVDDVTAETNVPVDGAGALPPLTVKAPYQEHGPRPFTIAVTQQDDPQQTVS